MGVARGYCSCTFSVLAEQLRLMQQPLQPDDSVGYGSLEYGDCPIGHGVRNLTVFSRPIMDRLNRLLRLIYRSIRAESAWYGRSPQSTVAICTEAPLLAAR